MMNTTTSSRPGGAAGPLTTAVVLGALLALSACSSSLDLGRAAGSGSVSPPESYRHRLLGEAMSGLLYEEDQVLVDPTVAGTGEELSEPEAWALLAEAQALLARNRTIEAIGALTRLLVAAPDLGDPDAYETLGQALVREARSREALAAFLTATRLEPERVEARLAAASLLDRLGRRQDALAAFAEILDLDPNLGSAHARLASILYLAGDLDGARRHLEEAVRLGASVPGQLAVLVENGMPRRAAVRVGAEAGDSVQGGSLEVGPQVRLNPGAGSARSNETTCAATGAAPAEVVAGWNDYREPSVRLGVGVSLDGGATWTDTVLRPPLANQGDVEGDPMTAADPRTGTLWVGAMSWAANGGVFVARKQPGSALFDPPVMTIVDGGIDKGWMAAGARPGLPDTSRLYLTYNFGLQRSDDMGQTWSAVQDLGWDLGYLPRVGPSGELYVTSWDVWDGMWLRRSFDGGATVSAPIRVATLVDSWDVFDIPQIPGDFRVPNLLYLAVSPVDGVLYCVYMDTTSTVGGNANVDLYLTRSTDQGTTWTTPAVVNGDSEPPGDQFFPWLEVDGDGRLHLLFYDTRQVAQDDSAASAWVDAYYAWSEDGGDSWTEHRLTPTSFDSAYTDAGSGQFIGDYLGLGLGEGRAYPVYLSTQNGLREIFGHAIVWALFADDFESGDAGAWSATKP